MLANNSLWGDKSLHCDTLSLFWAKNSPCFLLHNAECLAEEQQTGLKSMIYHIRVADAVIAFNK